MIYIKSHDTAVLTPVYDAEIVVECPICGKTFPFPEFWEFMKDSDYFDETSEILCDRCSATSKKIHEVFERVGIDPDKHTTITLDIMQALAE